MNVLSRSQLGIEGITQLEKDVRKAALTSGKYRRGQRDKEVMKE